MRMTPVVLAASILAASALSAPARADVQITFVDGQDHPVSQVSVKGGKVRIDDTASHRGTMLYDTRANAMTVLMPERKAYMVMDEGTMAEAGARMHDAMAGHAAEMAQAQAAMQRRMAALPPEQRAMMEQMMGDRMQGTGGPAVPAAPSKVEIKRLGTSQKVAGRACKDVQVVVDGTPGATMCVVDPDSLGLPAADLATLKAMADGMQKMMAHLGPMADKTQRPPLSEAGFAVKREATHGSGVQILKSVSKAGLKDDRFAVPAGYTRQQMMAAPPAR